MKPNDEIPDCWKETSYRKKVEVPEGAKQYQNPLLILKSTRSSQFSPPKPPVWSTS